MALNDDIAVLRRVPFFDGFPEEALKLLAFSGENKRYAKGEQVFRAGEATQGGLIILSGALGYRAVGSEHEERLGVSTLIGSRALFARTERQGNATALEASETLLVRRTLFLRMLAEYPELAAALQARLTNELSQLSGAMAPIGERLKSLEG